MVRRPQPRRSAVRRRGGAVRQADHAPDRRHRWSSDSSGVARRTVPLAPRCTRAGPRRC
jgi:hypothetical protein